MIKKLHFTFDRTKKSQVLKKLILKKYYNYPPGKANYIIVAGGDGFMLNSLKKYSKFKKPFYGINCGTYGFLMNRYVSKNLFHKIKKAKKTSIHTLNMTATQNKNKKKSLMAINEVSLFRQSRQTASLKLKVGNKIIIKKLIGDGVLISSPAGSTAYNLSVHGPILSLNSKKLAITPISPFRPRRWKGITLSEKSKIEILNLDHVKRPISSVADNIEVRNAKKVNVKIDKKINFNLLYDKKKSLHKKIRIEQLRRETNTN